MARYDAYGKQTAGTKPSTLTDNQYAGAWGYEREPDAGLGLDYLYQRYYDSALGRFISQDPIRWSGGLNLYGYCEGDPVNAVDPDGLSPFDIGEDDTDDDITYWGRRNTKRLLSAGFHTNDTAYANHLHQQAGLARFRSGNRPLAMDAFNIHQTVGQIGGGGPVVGAAACSVRSRMVPVAAGGGNGPSTFLKIGQWLRGRLGNIQTRLQVRRIAIELERRGWTIVGGGQWVPHLAEEWIPRGPGRPTGTYVDITAQKNGRTLRVQTVDTFASGAPKPREARAIQRIRNFQKPGDHLLVIPKVK